jgi:NADPH:quinone reductase-like Zn-dependent oxidoreductase
MRDHHRVRAVVVTRHGPPEVLQVQSRPLPQPGPGEVGVAVEAAGLNFADVLARAGTYPDAPPPPCVLGYEVAGTVETVGDGVDAFRPGDRVMAATRFGGQAEHAVAGADGVIPIPDGLSTLEAAAIPINYGTALAALSLMAGVRAGETVLVHSAAGGVGMAAVQLASHYGAVVIGTASAAKHDSVRRQGADHVIDYRHADVAAEVRRITSGKGVDVALDALGPRMMRSDWQLLRPGGRLVMYGLSDIQTGARRNLRAALRAELTLPFATLPWWKGHAVLNENRGVFALNLKHWWDREGSLARLVMPLRELLQGGVIHPVVDSSHVFERAADAHRRLMDGRNIGKVVLVPN